MKHNGSTSRKRKTSETDRKPYKRQKNWTVVETSALLECVNLPRFRHQERNQSNVMWDAIAEETKKKLGQTDSAITGKRCMERMKTLRRYWENVRTEKKNVNVTEDEWHKSNGLKEAGWFEAIGDFQAPRKGKLMSAQKSARKKIAESFSSLNHSQRSTLFDLDMATRCLGRWTPISKICKWLSFHQNRRDLAIYKNVLVLEKMGFVRLDDDDEVYEEDDFLYGRVKINVHHKFLNKVLDRNPSYDTRKKFSFKNRAIFNLTSVQLGITITMLYLSHCEKLEVVDWRGFTKLRCLRMRRCPKLCEIIGWECLKELKWLEISKCPLLHKLFPLQETPSLQVCRWYQQYFKHTSNNTSNIPTGVELDVSGCVQLCELMIRHNNVLSSIRGLEGLHSLKFLELSYCKAFQNLPDIGHLSNLTKLIITGTDVEKIEGVEKLTSLVELHCAETKLKNAS